MEHVSFLNHVAASWFLRLGSLEADPELRAALGRPGGSRGGRGREPNPQGCGLSPRLAFTRALDELWSTNCSARSDPP